MPIRRRKSLVSSGLGLEAPWTSVFEEAWAAYRAATIPTGAVVTDAKGAVVARGRDRTYDTVAPAGRLAASPVAHAVVDALAALPPDRRYEDHTVWTSVEPCLLCHGAAVTATVGAVRFASSDPYAGTAHVAATNPHAARRPLEIHGPLPGPAGLLGAVLRLELYLRVNPTGAVVETHRRLAPLVVSVAEQLLADDVFGEAARRGVAFAALVPDLVAALGDS